MEKQVQMSGVAGLVLATLISGCAVGPDFHRPETPTAASYTGAPLAVETTAPTGTTGGAQRLTPGREIPAQWWTLFHSSDLDGLVREALTNSPTLAAAQAALRQAQEGLRARSGEVYVPGLDGNLSAARRQITGAGFGQPATHFSPFTLYNASVVVTYGLDLFGGTRRELEALRARVDLQQHLLAGADLTLTSNIVTAAVRDALLRTTIEATREILEAQRKQQEVTEQRFNAGAVAMTEVLAQRTQTAQTNALLPPLEKEAAQNRHLLAALIGRFPHEEASLPAFRLESFTLPAELPVSLPSSLVRQRPDILAAEALLHAASAGIGVAAADQYPRITLSGNYGSEAGRTGDLFSAGTSVWSLGANLLQPLFHGGALSARKRQAVAAYDQASAHYRETVLLSFQNVADVLRALELDAQALAAQAEAEAAARQGMEIAARQFQIGAASFLTLLNAEQRYQEARIALLRARSARLADTAALFQAMGGGWWNAGPAGEKRTE